MQGELGDVVYVELREVGSTVEKGESFGVVESVKVRALQELREKAAGAGHSADGGECNHHGHHHHHHDHSDCNHHDHLTSLPVVCSWYSYKAAIKIAQQRVVVSGGQSIRARWT